jgi:TatD DNase family protein
LNQIPLKYVVLETDSPYLTPTPYRGKRNESAYINYVCLQLTSIYNLTRAEIIDKTSQNALEVFKKLPKHL